jgi:hypothetical protein
MAQLVRIIVQPPVKDGLFVQPKQGGPGRELNEGHNRTRFANKFNFADGRGTGNGRTYDPLGRYNCGRCNEADDYVCVEVSNLRIHHEAGSCKDWENQCAGDPEIRLTLVDCTTPELVDYGVAKNGIGFGCMRCPFASAAYEADSQGRDLYCGKGDFRTDGTACCELNGAELVGEDPDEDYDEDDEEPTPTDKKPETLQEYRAKKASK